MDEKIIPRRKQRVYSTSPSRSLFESDPISEYRDDTNTLLDYEQFDQSRNRNVAYTAADQTIPSDMSFSTMQSFTTYTMQTFTTYEYEGDDALNKVGWCGLCRMSEVLLSEIEGSFIDAVDAVDQVVNAFTLQEEDIRAVTSRIDKASKQLPYWTRHK